MSRVSVFVTTRCRSHEIASVDVPLDALSAELLHAAGQPSLFGHDEGNVYDESYRLARELRPPHVALSADPVLVGDILPLIRQQLGIERPLRAVPYKMNTYALGGFFAAHRDTPKGKDHIGTITVCLPSEFEGGELVVRHNGQEVKSQWSADVRPPPNHLGWMFLYADCDHEVLPVTSGTRVTVAYDVFAAHGIAEDQFKFSDTTELEQDLISAYQNLDFMPDGGHIAFALQHAYPCMKYDDFSPTDLAKQLKGGDLVWLRTVQAAKLDWTLLGVFSDRVVFPSHDPKKPRLAEPYRFKGRDLPAHESFSGLQGRRFGDGYDDWDWKWFFDDKHVAWVTVPIQWGDKNTYMSYGNEWDPSWAYVNVALVAKIPSAKERAAALGGHEASEDMVSEAKGDGVAGQRKAGA